MVTLVPGPSAVVDREVTASLSDEDGGVTGITWQWSSADAMDGTFSGISGATSASYTPVEDDVDMYLRVTVDLRGHPRHWQDGLQANDVMVSVDDRPAGSPRL